jgi:hypothetical protein
MGHFKELLFYKLNIIITMFPTIVITLLLILLILYLYKMDKEHYSQGALIQLMAKGPQDMYMTGDAWKHMYYPVYDPYYGSVYGFRSPYPYYNQNNPYFNPGVRHKKSEKYYY